MMKYMNTMAIESAQGKIISKNNNWRLSHVCIDGIFHFISIGKYGYTSSLLGESIYCHHDFKCTNDLLSVIFVEVKSKG